MSHRWMIVSEPWSRISWACTKKDDYSKIPSASSGFILLNYRLELNEAPKLYHFKHGLSAKRWLNINSDYLSLFIYKAMSFGGRERC